MKQKNSILGFCLLAMFTTFAQWKISSCDELKLRPIEPRTGNDLLSLYLETEKFEKKGCWVHHHNNKKDFVVTPQNWSREPNKERQAFIDEAFQALTDSRRVYQTYKPLKSDLYYILDDVDRGQGLGEAFWLINNDCWMQSGVPKLRTRSFKDRKQVYAHEVGHCFVMENLLDLKNNYELNNWFDESVSEYLSSQVYPANNYEHRFSKLFNFNKPFRQPYTIYPLWQQFVSRQSKSSLVPFLDELTKRNSVSLRRDYMRRNGFDQLLHNFLYDFCLSKIKDTGGGPIPVTNTIRKVMSFQLNPMLNRVDVPVLVPDQLQIIELRIPPGFDVTLSPISINEITIFQSLLLDKVEIRNWNSPRVVEGNCENEITFRVLVSHLNNKELSNLKMKYDLKEKDGEDECCKEGDSSDNCTLCFAPLDFDNVSIKDNPTGPNSLFKFNYWIESNIEIRAEGVVRKVKTDYYVNTSDGSMFFPQGFALANFGATSNRYGALQGALWMPNGQMVMYVLDKDNVKRAVLVETKQTSSDVFSQKYMNASHFMQAIENMTKIPDPLPNTLSNIWQNTLGFTGEMFNQDGSKSKGTIYFALNPNVPPIKTNSPLVGFLTGIYKDFVRQNCNKLAVYSKFEMGDDSKTSDYIKAELLKIKPKARTFDGSDYKIMTIGGAKGTDYKAKMTSFEARYLAIEQAIEEAKKQKSRCGLGTQFCVKKYDKIIEDLKEDKLKLQCEVYRLSGVEDKVEECKKFYRK